MRFIDLLTALWDWSRTIFGSVFVFCVIVALDLLIVELFYYSGKKAREQKRQAVEQAESCEGSNILGEIENVDEVEKLLDQAFKECDREGEYRGKTFSEEAPK